MNSPQFKNVGFLNDGCKYSCAFCRKFEHAGVVFRCIDQLLEAQYISYVQNYKQILFRIPFLTTALVKKIIIIQQ